LFEKKKNKTSKHPNKIHILQKICNKNQHFKIVFKLKKNGRFAYLKWRIFNKISIRTRMLINRVLWWLKILWEVKLYWDWEGGVAVLLQRKLLQGRNENEGGEEKGQPPGHKLNIIDGFTDEIIHWRQSQEYHIFSSCNIYQCQN